MGNKRDDVFHLIALAQISVSVLFLLSALIGLKYDNKNAGYILVGIGSFLCLTAVINGIIHILDQKKRGVKKTGYITIIGAVSTAVVICVIYLVAVYVGNTGFDDLPMTTLPKKINLR